jgi:hypothetical protein
MLAAGLASGQTPPPAELQKRALQTVTAFAQGYIDRLPDFTCVRTTQHYVARAATRRWQPEAKAAYELSYYGHDEHYRLLSVDDKPARKIPKLSMAKGWLEMNGNFGWILKQLFEPGVHPHFEWHGWDTVQGKRAMAFSYQISLAESHAVQSLCGSWVVFSHCKEKNYAFHGQLFIDEQSLDILRISDTPDGLSGAFAQGDTSVDYGRITVAGGEYLLPIADQIETFNGSVLFRNDSTYSDYRKFVAESTFRTEEP